MAKSYSGKYDYDKLKNVDWGGSQITNNLPLDGKYVQRIIKDTFNTKVGCIKQVGDYVCAFANETDYEKYLSYMESGSESDIEKAEALILNSWQGIKANVISLNMTYPETANQALLYGTEGINLSFTFDTQDQAGNHSMDEQATVVVTVKKGVTTLATITEVHSTNERVRINLDKYLQTGDNTVTLKITGNDSTATISRTFVFSLIQLTFIDEFDVSKEWNPNEIPGLLTIPYRVTAPATTVNVTFVIDGDVEHKYVDTLVSPAGTLEQKKISISGLNEGVHTLQMVASCMVGNDIFPTDIHYKEFIVTNKVSSIPYVAISNNIPMEYGEEPTFLEPNAPIVIYGAQQYASTTIEFGVYSYNKDYTNTVLYLDDEKLAEMEVRNNVTVFYKLFPTQITTNSKIKIEVYDDSNNLVGTRIIGPFAIEQTSMDISEVSTGLILDLKARGRTNGDINKDSWDYEGYHGTLTNFEWTDISGWDDVNSQLVVGDGNILEIDCAPFSNPNSITANGLTFILEFATDNVSDDDAVICDMTQDDMGLKITASEIYYNFTSGIKAVSAKFKSGELNRVALVIQENKADGKQLICLYVNGIISAAYHYTSSSLQPSDKNIKFMGSGDAEVHIKEIKVHNYAFISDEAVNDYILSRDILYDTRDANGNLTARGMLSLYEANNIYESGSKHNDNSTVYYDTEAIANFLPVMFMTGRAGKDDESTLSYNMTSLHELEDENKSKDRWVFVDIQYINNQHPELNFYAVRARIKIQGTSSLNYTKKNYKVSTNNKKYATKVWTGATCMEMRDEDLCPSGAFSFKKAKGESDSLQDPGVGIKAAAPVYTYVLKADCSDSSSAHNTGVARMWNELFKNFTISGKRVGMTKAQKLAEESNYPYDVRTCVDGFPIVLFYRETEADPWEFIGKYNFNNDKGTAQTYGFEGGIFDSINGRTHAYELLDSADAYALGLGDMSHFLDYTTKGDGQATEYNYEWMKGFESRYPEQPDNEWSATKKKNKIQAFVEDEEGVKDLKEFYEWLASVRYLDDDVVIDSTKKIDIISKSYPERNQYNIPDTKENRKAKFYAEKWDHFDMYKVGAYYDYLMRYAGVDQVVKNAIFMTEGNQWNDSSLPCQWFYINYDNDTVLGSRNDGRLAYGPYIERRSASEEETDVNGNAQKYAFAGEGSVIWNQLEEDAEFQSILIAVDNALVTAGMTYSQMIYYFNTLQSEKWPERIYNRDQIYKYLSAYLNKNIADDIPLLQGSRVAHRKWWISKRFALYDSRYVSGDYANKMAQFKTVEEFCNDGLYRDFTGDKLRVNIVPGDNVYFGYYVKTAGNPIQITGLGKNYQPFTAEIPATALTVGNYVNIFAPESIAEFDASLAMHGMTSINMGSFYDNTKGTKLKKLKLGDTVEALKLKNSGLAVDKRHHELYMSYNSGFTSLDLTECSMIEYLDLYGLRYLGTLDLSGQKYLKTYRGFSVGASSISFANGCPLETAEISKSCLTLALDGLNKLNSDGISFEDNEINVRSLTIDDCALLSKDHQFVFNWFNNKTANGNLCSLTLNKFVWGAPVYGEGLRSSDINTIISMKKSLKSLELNGTIYLDNLDSNTYAELISVFGKDCFDYSKNTALKLRLNGVSIFVYPKNKNIQMYEGNNYELEYDLVGSRDFEITKIEYKISATWNEDLTGHIVGKDTINKTTGVISLYESGIARNVYVDCTVEAIDNKDNSLVTSFGNTKLFIEPKVYPSTVKVQYSLNSDNAPETALTSTERNYNFSFNVSPDIQDAMLRGNYDIQWSLEEHVDAEDQIVDSSVLFTNVVSFVPGTDTQKVCSIRINTDDTVIKGKIRVTLTAHPTNDEYMPALSSITDSMVLIVKSVDSLISIYENSVMYNICKAAGLTSADNTSMSYDEARAVQTAQLNGVFVTLCQNNTAITEFNAFREFTNVDKIPDGCFSGCTRLAEILFPTSLSAIGAEAFRGCTSLKSVKTTSYLTTIGEYAFYSCSNLAEVNYYVDSLGTKVQYIGDYAFARTALKVGYMPNNLKTIGSHVFDSCLSMLDAKIELQKLEGQKELPAYSYYNCTSLTGVTIPDSLEYIREYAFNNCTKLKAIDIPENVINIGDRAFGDCPNIERIKLGTLNPSIHLDEVFTLNYGVFKKMELKRGSKVGSTTLASILGNGGRGCQKIECVVLDNDFTTLTALAEAKTDNGVGFYSSKGSLYYYNGTNLSLIRYYAPETIDEFDIVKTEPLYLEDSCLSCIIGNDLIFPDNAILDDCNYTLTNMEVKTLTFKTSIANVGGRFFANFTASKGVYLCEGETYIPDAFGFSNTNIYLQKLADDFSVGPFVKTNSFSPCNKFIYVLSEDFDKLVEAMKNSECIRYDMVRLYNLPEVGYINIIKSTVDTDGNQHTDFINKAVIIGENDDEDRLEAFKIYDGSYKYENPDDYRNGDIYMDATKIGTIDGYITEILIPENESKTIDFTKLRVDDEITTKQGLSNINWNYNPILKGLSIPIDYGVKAESVYLIINIPESFNGQDIWVRYHLESNISISNGNDVATILSGSSSDKTSNFSVIVPSTEMLQSTLKEYDSYREVKLENWPGGRLMIKYTIGNRTRTSQSFSFPHGIDGIVLKAIYVDGFAPEYPDASSIEWMYFNLNENISNVQSVSTIGVAHYDIDTDETEVTIFGLPSKSYASGMDACVNYWTNIMGYGEGSYANASDIAMLQSSSLGLTNLDAYSTDPDNATGTFLPKIVLPFNNRINEHIG